MSCIAYLCVENVQVVETNTNRNRNDNNSPLSSARSNDNMSIDEANSTISETNSSKSLTQRLLEKTLNSIIQRLIRKDPSLKEISLCGNNNSYLVDSWYINLSTALLSNNTLVTIELYSIGMNDTQCLQLSDALVTCSKLSKLNISGNKLTSTSIKPLTELIEKHPKISELILLNLTIDLSSDDRLCLEESLANMMSQNMNIIQLNYDFKSESIYLYVKKFLRRNQDRINNTKSLVRFSLFAIKETSSSAVSNGTGTSTALANGLYIPYPYPKNDIQNRHNSDIVHLEREHENTEDSYTSTSQYHYDSIYDQTSTSGTSYLETHTSTIQSPMMNRDSPGSNALHSISYEKRGSTYIPNSNNNNNNIRNTMKSIGNSTNHTNNNRVSISTNITLTIQPPTSSTTNTSTNTNTIKPFQHQVTTIREIDNSKESDNTTTNNMNRYEDITKKDDFISNPIHTYNNYDTTMVNEVSDDASVMTAIPVAKVVEAVPLLNSEHSSPSQDIQIQITSRHSQTHININTTTTTIVNTPPTLSSANSVAETSPSPSFLYNTTTNDVHIHITSQSSSSPSPIPVTTTTTTTNNNNNNNNNTAAAATSTNTHQENKQLPQTQNTTTTTNMTKKATNTTTITSQQPPSSSSYTAAPKTNQPTEINIRNQDLTSAKLGYFKTISTQLFNNTQIKSIVLMNVGMKDDHCKLLMSTLSTCTSLEILNLECNRLSHIGMIAIADVIRAHPSLIEVKLDNQYTLVGRDGEKALVDAMAENMIITKFSYTFKDTTYKNYMDSYMRRNGELKRLKRLHGNTIMLSHPSKPLNQMTNTSLLSLNNPQYTHEDSLGQDMTSLLSSDAAVIAKYGERMIDDILNASLPTTNRNVPVALQSTRIDTRANYTTNINSDNSVISTTTTAIAPQQKRIPLYQKLQQQSQSSSQDLYEAYLAKQRQLRQQTSNHQNIASDMRSVTSGASTYKAYETTYDMSSIHGYQKKNINVAADVASSSSSLIDGETVALQKPLPQAVVIHDVIPPIYNKEGGGDGAMTTTTSDDSHKNLPKAIFFNNDDDSSSGTRLSSVTFNTFTSHVTKHLDQLVTTRTEKVTVEQVIDRLRKNDMTFHEIILNNTPNISDEDYINMLELLTHNTHIVNIELANTCMTNDQCVLLLSVINTLPNLKKLNLDSNFLNTSMKYIAKMIESNTTLLELKINNQFQSISPYYEKLIINGLSQNFTLLKLSFKCTTNLSNIYMDKYIRRNMDLLRQQRKIKLHANNKTSGSNIRVDTTSTIGDTITNHTLNIPPNLLNLEKPKYPYDVDDVI